ncbi:hypothetical protein HPP92_022257 [Vanilla planifolia]|uniref:Uncharacterized protein n=1 Tax=Vanilla planifolia TaxID=51239 RepID=A0A835UDM5_VANPL|nr:hypothetical protein HPP92_022257 [Vanilla planifolia]
MATARLWVGKGAMEWLFDGEWVWSLEEKYAIASIGCRYPLRISSDEIKAICPLNPAYTTGCAPQVTKYR